MDLIGYTTHPPGSVGDWIELLEIAVMGGLVMAGIAFVHGGKKALKVIIERSVAFSEDGFFGRFWKLNIFVLGETIVYQGFGMTYSVDYCGQNTGILLSAAVIGVAQGLLPPHHHLPIRTRIAAMFGSFVLSLIFLKCGGWGSTWPEIREGLIVAWLAHLVPVGILSALFFLDDEDTTALEKPAHDTPRPP